VQVTFDPKKDAANTSRHGVSLGLSTQINWDHVTAEYDDRDDYGEDRYVAAAPINGRLHVVVFTIRDDALRIISLRKATRREIKRHENQA
jgi:uncharacterized protein